MSSSSSAKMEVDKIAADANSSTEPSTAMLPNMALRDYRFQLAQHETTFSPTAKKSAKEALLSAVFASDMAPYYAALLAQFGWERNAGELARMKSANAQQLAALDAAIADAVENFGESEVRDAHLKKAEYLLRIGDKPRAIAEYRSTFEKTVGAGSKLELVLTMIRIGFFFDDVDYTKRHIEEAKILVETGGDWDRRNRLKDYEAVYLISTRRFDEAAALLIDTLSTYNASEIMSFEDFVALTTVTGLVSLERAPLREKLAESPELVIPRRDNSPLCGAVDALLAGEYRQFFEALVEISDCCNRNRLLAPHTSFIMRELRIRGYKQMLSAYRSVRLSVMAEAFGVSDAFLDRELARFIALGRLACKIDRVGGVIEMQRPDDKVAQFQNTLKQGDALLNKIQKLARVINM